MILSNAYCFRSSSADIADLALPRGASMQQSSPDSLAEAHDGAMQAPGPGFPSLAQHGGMDVDVSGSPAPRDGGEAWVPGMVSSWPGADGIPAWDFEAASRFQPQAMDRKSVVERKAWEKLRLALSEAGMPTGTAESGWHVEVKERMSGISKSQCDVYYFSPDGRRYRSQREVVQAVYAAMGASQAGLPWQATPAIASSGHMPPAPPLNAYAASTPPEQPVLMDAGQGYGEEGLQPQQQQQQHADDGPSALHPGVPGAWPAAAADQQQPAPQHRVLKIKLRTNASTAASAEPGPQARPPPPGAAAVPQQPGPSAPAPYQQPILYPAAPRGLHSPALKARQPRKVKAKAARGAVGVGRSAAAAARLAAAWPGGGGTGRQPTALPSLNAEAPGAPRMRLVLKQAPGASHATDASALELLMDAALGQEQQELRQQDMPALEGAAAAAGAAAPAGGHESDPGSGSATDLAPGSEPCFPGPAQQQQQQQQDVSAPAEAGATHGGNAAGFEVHRGSRASFRKRLRGQAPPAKGVIGNGPGHAGHRGNTEDGEELQGAELLGMLRHPSLSTDVEGEQRRGEAVRLLNSALPALASAVRVVHALREQGIGGQPFDQLAEAVRKVQAACACLTGPMVA